MVEFVFTLGIAIVAGIVPMLMYLAFIYWLDRYEREPWWLVALVFLWGGFGGAGLGCCVNTALISGLNAVFDPSASSWMGPVLIAPIVEEVTKIVPLFGLLFLRHFDNATDGLIYGAATGLGFAMTENITYFYGVGSSAGMLAMFMNIVIRTGFTALVHCSASAAWGFFLGTARYRHFALRWLVVPVIGYASAVAIHAAWNGSATYSSSTGSLSIQVGACGLVLVLAVLMFSLTQVSLYLEHRLIKKHLAMEASAGVLPAAHAAIIPYWRKRSRTGWLPPSIDRERYVKAATLLAFRLNQVTHAAGSTARALEEDIRRYRAELRMLLSAQPAWPHQGPPAPPAGGRSSGGGWPQDQGTNQGGGGAGWPQDRGGGWSRVLGIGWSPPPRCFAGGTS